MSSDLDCDPSPVEHAPSPVRDESDVYRVEDLWFPDGTLVLEAENALFRVYGGLLGKTSPLFHDMLQLPQPAESETIEGCPVVHLNDNKFDVTCFLKAVFDHEFFTPFPSLTDFDTIAGVLRLSKKYDVESLRKRALAHLSSAFPSRLAQWPGTPSWKVPSSDWIRVILLAREISLEWILPVAFYRAAEKCNTSELLRGITVRGVQYELAEVDKLACLDQALAIVAAACAEVTQCLWDPVRIQDCRNGSTGRHLSSADYYCTSARMEAHQKADEFRRQRVFPMNLLLPEDWSAMSVCTSCLSHMQSAHQEALGLFWETLPQRFGLPGWEELERMKEADLA